MSYQPSHYSTPESQRPLLAAADLDAFFIDDEDDDFLDRHLADLRETLADFRSS